MFNIYTSSCCRIHITDVDSPLELVLYLEGNLELSKCLSIMIC